MTGETTTIKCTINGTLTDIKIKNDIPWGSFQNIITNSEVNGRFSFNNFVDLLLEEVIVDGVDPKDRTNFKQLGTLEVTELIGKVGEVIPLEKYFKNLKVDQGGIAGALTNPQT